MIINEHSLDGSTASGNGHHGNCTHCGMAFVTDLGYCSWEGVKWVDREIVDTKDMPSDILSYTDFNGLIWNQKEKLFLKPYSDITYTLDELNKYVKCIK